MTLAWLFVVLPAMTLFFGLLNRLTWPRGQVRRSGRSVKLSVLVPARNEVENIEACVRAVAASGADVHEVLVYDDASTDGTSDVLARLSSELPVLRVLKGQGLPPGWVGKPHACHRLAEAATGDILMFVDADVRIERDGIARALELLERLDAGVVTAVPRQRVGSFFERLVLPLLHLTYVAWFPLVLTYLSRDPRFLAANGQLLLVRRKTYDAVGGFEAVRSEVVDDMAFCRRVKVSGARVVFADGHRMGACRMYRSAGEVIRGFSKNLYEGIGASLVGLVVVLALYLVTFVAPYVLLIAAAVEPAWLWPAVVGVAMNVVLRAVLALRHDQPLEGVVLHPLSVLAFAGIAVNSALWQLRGAVEWRGRAYASRARRARDV